MLERCVVCGGEPHIHEVIDGWVYECDGAPGARHAMLGSGYTRTDIDAESEWNTLVREIREGVERGDEPRCSDAPLFVDPATWGESVAAGDRHDRADRVIVDGASTARIALALRVLGVVEQARIGRVGTDTAEVHRYMASAAAFLRLAKGATDETEG
jgi:hypothetical protein